MARAPSLTAAFRRLVDRVDTTDEHDFLPAALEVVQKPPSPTGRGLGLLIISFFAIAVAWAFIGKVDIEATAPGRILPTGDVKVIQPLDPGVVRAIDVENGDHVHAGQVLVELDPTVPTADRDRLAQDLLQAKLDMARLTALSLAAESGRPPVLVAPPDAPADLVDQTRAAMQAQQAMEDAKVADLSAQISQKDAESAEVDAQIGQLNATLPMLVAKEQIHHDLTAQGYGTSLAYLDAQQQTAEAKHQLLVLTPRVTQARDERASLAAQRAATKAQYLADIFNDLRHAQAQANEAGQELIQAQSKSANTDLRSPIDGVVDQLAIHSLHGVVTPAEPLMIVVPDNHKLMIEARLANRDVGFVHVGQPVKIKIETFNFTRYGLIEGRVEDVSRDTVTEAPQPQASAGQATPAQRPPDGGSPAYVARISLSRTSMMVDGHEELLEPGMSITAEIRTGRRTIADYLLSPIARHTSESLHER